MINIGDWGEMSQNGLSSSSNQDQTVKLPPPYVPPRIDEVWYQVDVPEVYIHQKGMSYIRHMLLLYKVIPYSIFRYN